MAAVQDFVLGKDVFAGKAQPPARVFHSGHRQILAGYYRLDAGQGGGFGGVNGLDAGVGVGAPQHLAVQQAGQLKVAAVLGAAGYFVGPVVAKRPGADHAILRI